MLELEWDSGACAQLGALKPARVGHTLLLRDSGILVAEVGIESRLSISAIGRWVQELNRAARTLQPSAVLAFLWCEQSITAAPAAERVVLEALLGALVPGLPLAVTADSVAVHTLLEGAHRNASTLVEPAWAEGWSETRAEAWVWNYRRSL